MKKIIGVFTNQQMHWVGNGFPVRSLFAYSHFGRELSPFLLLDYAGPADFPPSSELRGVGSHPHRGFETVTIVYSGEVSHRDSTGEGGTIYPGDVQWMTAGAGIVHEEFHSSEFTHNGGTLEIFQLWVNLPAVHKMTPPKYQSIRSTDIPKIDLPSNSGYARIIAGNYGESKGPASTYSPVYVWDLFLNSGSEVELPIPDGWTSSIVVRKGSITTNQSTPVHNSQFIIFEKEGQNLHLKSNQDSSLLLLAGEPLNEPIVGYGPFVMNTEREIHEAIHDFNSGKFGVIK